MSNLDMSLHFAKIATVVKPLPPRNWIATYFHIRCGVLFCSLINTLSCFSTWKWHMFMGRNHAICKCWSTGLEPIKYPATIQLDLWKLRAILAPFLGPTGKICRWFTWGWWACWPAKRKNTFGKDPVYIRLQYIDVYNYSCKQHGNIYRNCGSYVCVYHHISIHIVLANVGALAAPFLWDREAGSAWLLVLRLPPPDISATGKVVGLFYWNEESKPTTNLQ